MGRVRPRPAGGPLRLAAWFALLVLAGAGPSPADPAPASALEGWAEDDHAAALATFRRSCAALRTLRGRTRALCREARIWPLEAAAAFFDTRFAPVRIVPDGFLTGYYEPELAGTLTPEGAYRVPLLGRPACLVARPAGPVPAGWPEPLTAACRTGAGSYEALPDRAAIEAGALDGQARPVVFLADPVDAFTVHVQGSARIRLPDGATMRVGFDGRNGHPYTAIGRVLALGEGLPPAELTADRLNAWLRANPDRAPALMRQNRSYIFFRRLETPPGDGPLGAAGVPLTPGRSLAVDPRRWPYGTLVWLEGELPQPDGSLRPLRRLVVAQDTGAAIVGLARGDLFFGSGEAAGAGASLVRHPVRWTVLRPRETRDGGR